MQVSMTEPRGAANWVDLGPVRLMPNVFNGHALVVRKCLTGERDGDSILDRSVGGILLPQSKYSPYFRRNIEVSGRSLWVEVLALGPKVGKRCTVEHAALYGRDGRPRPRILPMQYQIGQFVACPNLEVGIKESFWAECDFFIEESVPFIAWE